MERKEDFTFRKSERLRSRRVIEAMFNGGGKSVSAFPLRAVFMPVPADAQSPPVSVLVSVSKRRFKRAVKRNRVKRQIREAYRKNKSILADTLSAAPEQGMAVAFLWLSDNLHDSAEVESCVKRLLVRISEYVRASWKKQHTQ